MTQVAIGKAVPEFSAPATGSKTVSLSGLKGHPVVLYFYPKDDTPGCTMEGADFRDQYPAFRKLKAEIFGVSRDSVASHEAFKTKLKLPFDLLSDEKEALCEVFDVIRMKNMYGKHVRGIERSTFLIDADGRLRREWRKVKVEGHVDEVLDAIKQLA